MRCLRTLHLLWRVAQDGQLDEGFHGCVLLQHLRARCVSLTACRGADSLQSQPTCLRKRLYTTVSRGWRPSWPKLSSVPVLASWQAVSQSTGSRQWPGTPLSLSNSSLALLSSILSSSCLERGIGALCRGAVHSISTQLAQERAKPALSAGLKSIIHCCTHARYVTAYLDHHRPLTTNRLAVLCCSCTAARPPNKTSWQSWQADASPQDGVRCCPGSIGSVGSAGPINFAVTAFLSNLRSQSHPAQPACLRALSAGRRQPAHCTSGSASAGTGSGAGASPLQVSLKGTAGVCMPSKLL